MSDASFIEFKLDYSGTKDLAIGEPIIHDEGICAGGRTWTVACHPRGVSGDLSNDGEHVALHAVAPAKSADAVKAIFQAFVTRRDETPCFFQVNRSQQVTYAPGTGYAHGGWKKFVTRSELESACLVDGCVTFICGIIVLHDDRIPVPASDLGSHLGHLLDCTAEDGSDDVSFSVGGETFRAHRAFLAARSQVFKAQLLGPMADAKMDRITLHDIQPETFRTLVRLTYIDALPPADKELEELEKGSLTTTERLQDLLAAADMYHLDRLKLMCAQKLWEGVSADTVTAILGCAEMHNCPELKKRCMDFFVVEKNFKNAVLTEGYLRLMQSFPSVIDEIRARVQT